jgi:prepilin-type processing-associated H-X9-DG protein
MHNQIGGGASYWRKLNAAGKYADAPVFGDCLWDGTEPHETDPPPSGPGLQNAGNMSNFCIPRHPSRRPSNMVFVDGSASIVGLREMYGLHWSATYDPTLAASVIFPAWMKGYQ